MRTDVASGMIFSNLVAWFIILTMASTLFRNGQHQIESATQAAQALKPLAGDLAGLIFAVGIIGTGLLAVPVLAGSAAYAIASSLQWPKGLGLKLPQAPGFYGVIALATLVGAGINLIGINPIEALYLSAVINGLVAPPLLALIMLIGGNRQLMKDKVSGPLSNFFGWLTAVLMGLAALALIANVFMGG